MEARPVDDDECRRAADPFGNILGIMYNPHYLDTLATKSQ